MLDRATRKVAVLAAAVWTLVPQAQAQAQAQAPVVAVAYYGPADFAQGLYRHWYAPRADEFAVRASALPGAVQAYCDAPAAQAPAALRQARGAWRNAAAAWDTLSAVAVGPLLTRRSMLRIDFSPTRPALLERAMRAGPTDLAALERVGSPAKGLPGLEWLLWTKPAWPQTPGCRYAVLVARDIEREARALAREVGQQAARDWKADEAAAVATMDEALNQWVGGLERLRWAQMEKPQRAAQPGEAPAYPRSASGSTAASWTSQWHALQALGAAADGKPPAPGAGLVPFETYLRGRGLNPLADKLAQATAQATRALAQAGPADAASTLAASGAIAALKRLAEAELAPALDIHIGFSDNDGD